MLLSTKAPHLGGNENEYEALECLPACLLSLPSDQRVAEITPFLPDTTFRILIVSVRMELSQHPSISATK